MEDNFIQAKQALNIDILLSFLKSTVLTLLHHRHLCMTLAWSHFAPVRLISQPSLPCPTLQRQLA